jgi:hypothetical protein
LDRVDRNSGFRTPVEELEHLENELAGIRSLLREATAKLAQIERHVRRAFPDAKPARTPPQCKPQTGGPDEDKPSLVHETALELFEALRHTAENEGSNAVEKRLSELSVADVRFLSQELGLPSGSKLSRARLNSGITGRLNESILLSRNINVTPSRSGQKPQFDSFDSGNETGKND